MPNGYGRNFLLPTRNPLELFGGGTLPYLGAPGGYGGRAAGVAPAPRKTALQRYQEYPDRPQREELAPISRKRRLGAALAAFAARFGGGPGAGLAVGQQITGAPRRAQEAEYQRGLEEWETGRERAREAYTLEGEEQRRGQYAEEAKRRAAAETRAAGEYGAPAAVAGRELVPETPEAARARRGEIVKDWEKPTHVKEYFQETGRMAPVPQPRQAPQRHPSMLQQWLSSQMAQLARLRNDPMGDPAVVAREEQRILEQYNQQAPSYGVAPITELPGSAARRQGQPSEDDPAGVLGNL